MPVIDFHNHYYPPKYMKALQSGESSVRVTIDADGNHWAYCHGTAVHVQEGQDITAGTQILTSGNTGRSGTPHLHIELHLPDGSRRCLGPLLAAIRVGTPVTRLDSESGYGCWY